MRVVAMQQLKTKRDRSRPGSPVKRIKRKPSPIRRILRAEATTAAAVAVAAATIPPQPPQTPAPIPLVHAMHLYYDKPCHRVSRPKCRRGNINSKHLITI